MRWIIIALMLAAHGCAESEPAWAGEQVTILQAALNGGERRANDFYPTPAECTQALIPQLYRHGFPDSIHEPACGHGHGEGGIDFLRIEQRFCDGLVTNPPFGGLVSRFIEHAFDLDYRHIAMLVNVNLWHAKNRTKLWERRQPEAIYALCWKPDFTGAGRPYFNCVWTVWGRRSAYETKYGRLEKPRVSSRKRHDI